MPTFEFEIQDLIKVTCKYFKNEDCKYKKPIKN